jgi:hypothetical protein
MRRSSVLMGSTIGFGVLYLAATVALGTPPKSSDSGAVVAAWFAGNGSHVRTWAWLLTLSLPLFATFVVLVRERLPHPFDDVFLFGGVAFAGVTVVQTWFWAGLALHGKDLAPATAITVFSIVSYWGPTLTAITVLMLAPIAILGLRGGDRGLPRWLGVVSALALAEQLIETITIFGHDGFLAPGGPMNSFVGAGAVVVAWFSLAISLTRTAAD